LSVPDVQEKVDDSVAMVTVDKADKEFKDFAT
jgi:hypothetical protein